MGRRSELTPPETVPQVLASLMQGSLEQSVKLAQQTIISFLRGLGFRVKKGKKKRGHSFWAKLAGDLDGAMFAFVAHTDVVPTIGQAWLSRPETAVKRNGRIYCRGAVDMRGAIACFLVALRRFITVWRAKTDGPLPFSIGVMMAGDEETRDQHVRDRLERMAAAGKKIDYALVGEPTALNRVGDRMKRGARGVVVGRLKVHGKGGHAAHTERVENPNHLIAPLLTALIGHTWAQPEQGFSPTTLQVTGLNGWSGASNVVPDNTNLVMSIRYAPPLTRATVIHSIDGLLASMGLRHEIEWSEGCAPYQSPGSALEQMLVPILYQETGAVPLVDTDGGSSDGRFLAAHGTDVVELGLPVGPMHTANESVSLDDLDALERIYFELLMKLSQQ